MRGLKLGQGLPELARQEHDAQAGANPRHELAVVARLDQVVVGAGLERRAAGR